MAEYITIPIETDPDQLAQDAYDFIRIQWPDWEPSDAQFDTWLIQAIARMAAETRDVASLVPEAIFRWFGANILQLPPVAAAPAHGVTTWFAVDDQGYTIPAGTVITMNASGDNAIAFTTVGDEVIAPNEVSTDIAIVATEPGQVGSGLSGPVTLIDSLFYIDHVNATGPTTDGADSEGDEEYLSRLVEELRLLSHGVVLAKDAAVVARRIPGVYRATGIDNYDPATGTQNNERMVTVAVIDALGNALSAPVKASVDTRLQALRETNFIFHVVDPTYTNVTVATSVKSQSIEDGPVMDPEAIKAAIIAALQDYLSPARWGVPRGQIAADREWINDSWVRYLEVAQVINEVSGVDHIISLTLNGDIDDVPIVGAAPLPQAVINPANITVQ